jgi:hypothetical protein
MRTRLSLIMIILSLGGVAQGATLFTPPLSPGLNPFLVCAITNVGNTPKVVQIHILRPDGRAVVDSGKFTVQPGATTFGSADSSLSPVVCRFTADDRGVRASAWVVDVNKACIAVVTAE